MFGLFVIGASITLTTMSGFKKDPLKTSLAGTQILLNTEIPWLGWISVSGPHEARSPGPRGTGSRKVAT